jgi:nucleotide-binding universal stress UspA family protein
MEKLKILIPTDFSVQSEYAYLMVIKLEEKTPIDIHFLHVLAVPDSVTMDANGNIQTCGEIDVKHVTKQKEIAERKLADFKMQYGERINTHLVFGKITDAIIDFSENHRFDVIVMGRKGARGLKGKFSGTETQIIARKSSIPVLSMMCDRSDLDIKNIVLVHDYTNPEKIDLQLMHKLIALFHTKIHLLQITIGSASDEKQTIKENMKAFAELNHIQNYECHVISDKDVETGVVHFNQMNDMDMVCIGTHGKGSLFHHSATEKLIKHLFKPIISFHLN